jgi:hypothetical protein
MIRKDIVMKILWLTCMAFFGMAAGSYAAADSGLDDFYARLKEARPVEVRDVAMFKDGGTVAVFLMGPGDGLVFCRNGRMGSPTIGSLYANAPLAQAKEAVKVPSGGPVEELILDVLKEWLARDIDAAAYNEGWQKRQAKHGYVEAPEEILDAHRRWIAGLVQSVEQRRSSVLGLENAGGFTREKAIDVAKQLGFIKRMSYQTIEVSETPEAYTVIFVGVPFEVEGVAKESDMNVIISKETGKMVSAEASNVRYR